MAFDSLHVSADHDTELATYHWHAAAPPRAALVLIHGMAEHARRYDAFAAHLAAAGIDTYAFDLRGHGATTMAVDHGYLGTSATWNTLVDDVERIRTHVMDSVGQRPVFLFGHSLGSFIALRVLQKHGAHYAGAILSGTDTPNRMMCRLGALVATLESARVDPTGSSALLQRMTLGAYDVKLKKRLGMKVRKNAWITSNSPALDAYEADPHCGFAMRTDTWRRLFKGMVRTHTPHARRRVPAHLPLMLVAGLDDPMGGFGRGPTRLARSLDNDGQRDIDLHLYADARHELLHEHIADTVTGDIRAWIERHLSAIR
ncbi:alpha/beta fold hydrolase [Salinisphaera aquimarina]|uniref:Alpha/beta fold hydrolase n=1 Tax=Salinisphaera aquimarina TaxID=2094031 RepID=A0ABV7EL75_9GAMM